MADLEHMAQSAAAMQKIGRLDEAEALYRQIVAAQPRNPAALHMLGVVLAQLNRTSEALEMIEASLAVSPQDDVALTNRGKILLSEGRLPDALASFDAALAADPDNVNALLSRGVTLQEMGRLSDALRELKRCVSLYPQNALSLGEYANTLSSLGQWEAALESYDRALELAPRSVEFLNNRGGVLRAMKRYEAALESYDLALREMPNLPETLSNRGAVLADLGRLREALEECNAALFLQPQCSSALNNKGFVLRKLGRHREALACFEQTLSIDPAHIAAINNKAKTLCDLNEISLGFQSFLRAARLERRKAAQVAGRSIRAPDEVFYKEQLRYLSETSPELQSALASGELTLASGSRVHGPAIRPFDRPDEIAQARGSGTPKPLVIDDLLTGEALASLRHFCLGSNIWTRKYPGGYCGAFPEGGFACELLAQIAEEFGSKLPFMIGNHRLKYLWAFMYESQARGTSIHADEAAVNINFWITPTDANMNPESGGLILWDKTAPVDWDFEKFNNDPGAIQLYLSGAGARATKIPYKENRAVIFDSALFHQTDSVVFARGYTNQRINITMLFGERPT